VVSQTDMFSPCGRRTEAITGRSKDRMVRLAIRIILKGKTTMFCPITRNHLDHFGSVQLVHNTICVVAPANRMRTRRSRLETN
jgi:hypothetical protein